MQDDKETIEAQISSSSSTQILIKTNMPNGEQMAVGAIRKFNVSQSRDIRQEESYNEKTGMIEIELVPGPVETLLYLERTVFDRLSLPEAFGRGFRNIQSQTQPFDIIVEDIENNSERIISTYHNCWFKELYTPINADDYIIIQTATLYCEYISTQRVIKPHEAT